MDEGADSLLLTKDVMDRALMSRLLLPPTANLQWPLHYLLDVYSRASNELRSSPTTKDKALAEELQDVAAYAQELAVSHANLALSMDMFPQVVVHAYFWRHLTIHAFRGHQGPLPCYLLIMCNVQTPEARARGAKQLLDAMDRNKGLGPMTSSSAMPPGFLERFAAQYEEEGLAEIMAVLGTKPPFENPISVASCWDRHAINAKYMSMLDWFLRQISASCRTHSFV